jgi:serine/threonine protein kinase
MFSPLWIPIPGYAVDSLVLEDERYTLLRARRLSDATPVLVRMSRSDAPSRDAVLALRHEREVTSLLDVPEVVRPLHFERVGGRGVLVMDGVPGEPLSLRLNGVRATPQEFFALALPVVRALESIHAAGLVHGDLHPGNILVEPGGGRVWITGFGSAEKLDGEAAALRVDTRRDLQALGAVFYEILTGRPPFHPARSRSETAFRLARFSAPLAPLAVRRFLQRMVLRLLSADVGDGYLSASELLHDLELVQRQLPGPAFPDDHAFVAAGGPQGACAESG